MTADDIQAMLVNYGKERKKNGIRYTDSYRTAQTYAIERLMRRIGMSAYADKFTLKGAMAFVYYAANTTRTTGDADFLMRGNYSRDSIKNILSEIARIEDDDGVQYIPGQITVQEAGKERAYPGYVAHVPALVGKSRFSVQLDISFGEAVFPEAAVVVLPSLLLGADKSPRLRIYPVETIIAEKYQTIIRLGMGNYRTKDYHDLFAITHRPVSLNGPTLQEAIKRTFERRGTEITGDLPKGLSQEFYTNKKMKNEWNQTLKDHGMPKGTDLAHVCEVIAAFLLPVMAATKNGEQFNMLWIDGAWTSGS